MASLIFRRCFCGTVRPKRFYKKADVERVTGTTSTGCYQIRLDDNLLNTPAKKPLKIPSAALAHAVAQEWHSQGEHVRADVMRLTGLCMTAVDNPLDQSKNDLIEQILSNADADTILYVDDSRVRLRALQAEHWGTVVDWANQRFNMNLVQAAGDAITPVHIASECVQQLRMHLKAYDRWSLIGFDYGASALKSLLLMLAVCEQYIDVEKAVDMSLLEQRYQMEVWGQVEWAHDIEYHDHCSRVAAAKLFVHSTQHLATPSWLPASDNEVTD